MLQSNLHYAYTPEQNFVELIFSIIKRKIVDYSGDVEHAYALAVKNVLDEIDQNTTSRCLKRSVKDAYRMADIE